MLSLICLLALILSCSAFIPTKLAPNSLRLFQEAGATEMPITTPEETVDMIEEVSEPVIPTPPVKAPRLKAQWFPIGNMKAPKVLDGSLPGDVGFDPLGFSKNRNTLLWMREAEIKHGRLAMLGAVGWPISELFHKQIAGVFGLESILASGDRAPSLLNGGLQSVYASGALMMSIMLAGYLEGKGMNDGAIFIGSEKPDNYTPGDLNFDPLNMYSERNALCEVKNGRLAMIAMTAFAFQEATTGIPVVQETPYLF